MNSHSAARLRAFPRLAAICVTLAAASLPAECLAGSVWFPSGGGFYNVPIKSVTERKFEEVVRQQYDFSCGSAALATLLTFHYAEPTTEQKAFGQMYEHGDKEKIAKVGFSLLDMKTYLGTQGYEADGYKSSLDTLRKAGVPAIALITVKGYQHFVVIKGIQDTEVLLGDPALGIKAVSRPEFEKMWSNGILFIIRNKSSTAQKYFNMDREWRSLARAPMGMALSQESLASVTLALPNSSRLLLGDF